MNLRCPNHTRPVLDGKQDIRTLRVPLSHLLGCHERTGREWLEQVERRMGTTRRTNHGRSDMGPYRRRNQTMGSHHWRRKMGPSPTRTPIHHLDRPTGLEVPFSKPASTFFSLSSIWTLCIGHGYFLVSFPLPLLRVVDPYCQIMPTSF